MEYVALALVIISAVLTAVLSKSPKPTGPALFKDFDFPVPDEGTPQAVVFGDCWCSDWQVLWTGNYTTQTIRQKSKGK